MSGLILTPYAPEDLPAVLELFYDTVHRVCRADYERMRDLGEEEYLIEFLLKEDASTD